MSEIARLIAVSLHESGDYPEEIDEEYISRIFDIAPLHDIGKISIPDSVLLKPGRLTDEEFEIIKTHSQKGADIIDECLNDVERPEYVSMAKNVALYHHEKWNGKGYPEGLCGEKIPLCARISAVADVYDAVRSERCYKAAMTADEAKQVILDGSGSHFDPTVCNAFERVLPSIEKRY